MSVNWEATNFACRHRELWCSFSRKCLKWNNVELKTTKACTYRDGISPVCQHSTFYVRATHNGYYRGFHCTRSEKNLAYKYTVALEWQGVIWRLQWLQLNFISNYADLMFLKTNVIPWNSLLMRENNVFYIHVYKKSWATSNSPKMKVSRPHKGKRTRHYIVNWNLPVELTNNDIISIQQYGSIRL